ncbi:MAG: HEPN domain-containing protein [Candidatus Bathyarchaeia archaeon]
MHRGEIDILRRRASEFLYESESALKSGRYNLACFFSDQAVQLYAKSVLLEFVGDYPRTHSIRMLLEEILRCKPSKELEKLIRENRAVISSLEDTSSWLDIQRRSMMKRTLKAISSSPRRS